MAKRRRKCVLRFSKQTLKCYSYRYNLSSNCCSEIPMPIIRNNAYVLLAKQLREIYPRCFGPRDSLNHFCSSKDCWVHTFGPGCPPAPRLPWSPCSPYKLIGISCKKSTKTCKHLISARQHTKKICLEFCLL